MMYKKYFDIKHNVTKKVKDKLTNLIVVRSIGGIAFYIY